MENKQEKLAEMVGEGLTDEMWRLVSMRGRFYRVDAPTPYVLGRMLKWLGRIAVPESGSVLDMVAKNVQQYRYMDAAIATAIIGDENRVFGRWRRWLMRRRFSLATDAERRVAFAEIMEILVPTDFFVYARLAMELTRRLANTKQSVDGH
jgi:hypothetical protein